MRSCSTAREPSIRLSACLLVALALPATAAPAQDPAPPDVESGASAELIAVETDDLVSDRPDVTESTSIVPSGWLQAELGGSFEDDGSGGETLSAPGTLLRFGVAGPVEARLAWDGYQRQEPEDIAADRAPEEREGIADAEAALKILLLERAGARPDFALLPSVSLPIGEGEFTTGEFDPGLKALLANDFSSTVGWGANAGAAWPTEEDDGHTRRVRLLSWSYSVGFDVSRRVGGFLEYFGEDSQGEPGRHSLDAGLTFLASPDVQLDAAAGLGLNDAAADWFAGVGVVFRFGLGWLARRPSFLTGSPGPLILN